MRGVGGKGCPDATAAAILLGQGGYVLSTNIMQEQLRVQKRLYENRVYEGEWVFACRPCSAYRVEYSFPEFDKLADFFLSNTGLHTTESCGLCGGPLEWAGFSGDMPISDSFVSLVKNGHLMASTVILASIIENAINNLLWAALVDNDMEKEKANNLVNGRLSRSEILRMIRSLTQWSIRDIVFPIRNLVAHGKGFGKQEAFYNEELKKQVAAIRQWVDEIRQQVKPKNFMPTECERWLLFMDHWSRWLETYADRTCSAKGDRQG
jgi:hypothetical protein